jgi:hypothetical protein
MRDFPPVPIMDKRLDQALVRDFPLLYKDRHAHSSRTAMCWGFDCADGWEPLIRDLSAAIEPILKDMPDEHRPTAAQVKEKFGSLRFYMTGYNEAIEAAIHVAEKRSAETCELCGQHGKIVSHYGWLSARCTAHQPTPTP